MEGFIGASFDVKAWLMREGLENLVKTFAGGEPYDKDGQFDADKHQDNMKQALETYIERVDGTPCMSTGIKLYQGATNSNLTERRTKLLVFLKGSAKAKAELKRKHQKEYHYFEQVWKIRHNHADRTLPSNYVFLLKCCNEENCPHPLCSMGKNDSNNHPADLSANKIVYCTCRKEGTDLMICCDQCGEWFHYRCIGITADEGRRMSAEDVQFVCETCRQPSNSVGNGLIPNWYPGGPSFTFFPYPVIDNESSYGDACERCGGPCTGHYVTDIKKLLELRKNGKAIRSLPPSTIIKEAFEKNLLQDKVSLAKRCCLSVEGLDIWIEHLQKKKISKEKGVEKAKETRRKKKQAKE